MAKTYEQIIEAVYTKGNKMDFSNSMIRGNAIPLDITEVYNNLNDAIKYAAEGAVAYQGQILAVTADGDTTAYIITPTSQGQVMIEEQQYENYLKPIGTVPVGDDKSVTISDGKITLHGFESAGSLTLPRKTASGEIEWISIDQVVQGDGNTVTQGDNVSIETSGEESTLTAKIKNFDSATTGQIPYKDADGTLKWKNEYSYDDSTITTRLDGIDTQLGNIYTKSQTDSAIAAAIAEQTHMSVEVVEDLPAVESAQAGVIYLIADDAAAGSYIEYILVDKDGSKSLEQIGSTAVDLSGYATTEAMTSAIASAKSEAISTADSNADSKISAALVNYTPTSGITQALVVNTSELDKSDGTLKIVAVDQAKVSGLNKITYTKDPESGEFSQSSESATLVQILVPASYDSESHTGQAGLMSAEDKEKLSKLILSKDGSVEVSGNVNVDNVTGLPAYLNKKIDKIYVGTNPEAIAIEVESGTGLGAIIKGTIPVATSTSHGVVKSIDSSTLENPEAQNKVIVEADGTMTVNKLNVEKLVQTAGTKIILNGGAA